MNYEIAKQRYAEFLIFCQESILDHFTNEDRQIFYLTTPWLRDIDNPDELDNVEENENSIIAITAEGAITRDNLASTLNARYPIDSLEPYCITYLLEQLDKGLGRWEKERPKAERNSSPINFSPSLTSLDDNWHNYKE